MLTFKKKQDGGRVRKFLEKKIFFWCQYMAKNFITKSLRLQPDMSNRLGNSALVQYILATHIPKPWPSGDIRLDVFVFHAYG